MKAVKKEHGDRREGERLKKETLEKGLAIDADLVEDKLYILDDSSLDDPLAPPQE